ncbi:MAG: SsrA-binding protein SmpB [Candidatus Harrisonbacteria bacterium]|nr:SsrA-binding protein SmpB [Candidatus Harrisonbacteria bacterium]
MNSISPRSQLPKKIIATNRRASFDYELLDHYVAGLVLKGEEVKSVKLGRVSLASTFVSIKDGSVQLINCDISPYQPNKNNEKKDTKRPISLLVKKEELKKLIGAVKEKHYSIIPLNIFLIRGLVKIEFALARSKKLHDKRESIKKKDITRDISHRLA